MSETQFTRADWRPGKRNVTRPRKHAWGGQKRAPAPFLAMAKVCGLGAPNRRRCAAKRFHDGGKCGNVAMTGSLFCRVHGGPRDAAKTRPYLPTKRSQRWLARQAESSASDPSAVDAPSASASAIEGADTADTV